MYLELFKRDRYYFLWIVIIFAGGVLFGEYLPKMFPSFAHTLEQAVTEKLLGIAAKLKNMPVWIWILEIWINNLVASLTAVMTGMLLSPIFPLLILLGNGMIIGLFQPKMEILGLSAGRYYLSLLPHGILELSAFFIAVFLGIRFGLITYRLLGRYVRGTEKFSLPQEFFKEINGYFVKEGRYYALLTIILLFIAAIFEVTITPALFKR